MSQEMTMKKTTLIATALFVMGALAGATASGADIKVKLSGDNEVPPVKTMATGEGTISIGSDGSVSGSVATHGIDGTMGHIHMAAPGQNGPVIVKLIKDGDTFKVPADAKLDAAQMKAFQAGELYVNVHSAANKGGEIRGPLK
jgi:hypothetical protein